MCYFTVQQLSAGTHTAAAGAGHPVGLSRKTPAADVLLFDVLFPRQWSQHAPPAAWGLMVCIKPLQEAQTIPTCSLNPSNPGPDFVKTAK